VTTAKAFFRSGNATVGFPPDRVTTDGHGPCCARVSEACCATKHVHRESASGPEIADGVVALTLRAPPGATTHLTASAMAKTTGISISSVQRMWRGHGLQLHRLRQQFKLSNDPHFAAKLRDIVGLYVDPPAHAVVLSVDQKSQIQALAHTQPGLPLKRGRCGTMTHDYNRDGTTTLFADDPQLGLKPTRPAPYDQAGSLARELTKPITLLASAPKACNLCEQTG
jgi:hypothetical protein